MGEPTGPSARLALAATLLFSALTRAGAAEEFCLDGEFDLGARFQGLAPAPGEMHPARWCVLTEDDTPRVMFSARGRSNPDMEGDFTVAYLPPDTVRIVNRDDPPDIRFDGADIADEARRHRRIDPRRLVEELRSNPGWIVDRAAESYSVVYPGSSVPVDVRLEDGRLARLSTRVDLPLRGRVPVTWRWSWTEPERPRLTLTVDDTVFFEATGQWRSIDAETADDRFAPGGGVEPVDVPGDAWPARIDMRLQTVTGGVYLATGVRTGFRHLVIDTRAGLVVADAPAGWVELPQIPPADLVPGLGVSGLSARFIEFLDTELPGRPLRAVALTHAHDDHAGGARAFAAAGADVYAPAAVSRALTAALNRDSMPPDGLAPDAPVLVRPVRGSTRLGDERHPVELIEIGTGPHASASLGVLLPADGVFFVSDLHVPASDESEPRPERTTTECWFAHWAVANLDPEVVVHNSHSGATTPVSRLAQYLEADACR